MPAEERCEGGAQELEDEARIGESTGWNPPPRSRRSAVRHGSEGRRSTRLGDRCSSRGDAKLRRPLNTAVEIVEAELRKRQRCSPQGPQRLAALGVAVACRAEMIEKVGGATGVRLDLDGRATPRGQDKGIGSLGCQRGS